MNILQLQLLAFGAFTNKILDFSAKQPGFHLIYGPNEAGKSTLRRALINLFFGIPERTSDAHLHDNNKLRIGANVVNDDLDQLLFYRRKGRKNTLLDADNTALNEKYLLDYLGGDMDEAKFIALFCFDHDCLRQGGEDLLQAGGDVGESLFEAGSGSVRIHEVLIQLDKEKDELFKARGSKPLLNQTIKAYKEACLRIEEASLSAQKWSEHAQNLENAQQQHQILTEKLQNLRVDKNRLELIQRTRAFLYRHQEVKSELAKLAEVILLPEDVGSKRIQAHLDLRVAETTAEQAEQAIKDLEQQVSVVQISKALLAQKPTINDLRGRLGSHQKAARDLPGVRTEMRTVEKEAKVLLQRIYPNTGLSEVSNYTLSSLQTKEIKKLANSYPTLREKQNSLVLRLEEIEQQLIQQNKALDILPEPPDLTLLQASLARACKYRDLEESLDKDETEIKLLTDKINLSLQQLGWSSSLKALEQAPLPRIERIDSFERRFNEVENDRQRVKERLLNARQRAENSSQKINALSWAGEIPTEKTLEEVRKLRQQFWQQIVVKSRKASTLSLLEQVSPFKQQDVYKSFEEAMYHADELSDRLRREASRVAEYSMLLAEQQGALNEQEQQTKKWHQLETVLANLQNEWENSWKLTGIKPWTPSEMRGWLNECLDLRKQSCALRERRQKLQVGRELVKELSDELSDALLPLKAFIKGEVFTQLANIMEQANSCVILISQLQRKFDKLELEINNLNKDKSHTELAKIQADVALEKWQQEWQQALAPLDLVADTATETARDVLDTLDQILHKIDQANSLKRRVKLMEKDAKIFKADVSAIVKKLAAELIDEPVEQIVPELSNRLSQTEQDLARLEQLQHSLDKEQQHYINAKQEIEASQARLEALLEQAHCDNLADLEQAEQDSLQKKALQSELITVEQQLLKQGEGLSLSDLEKAAAEIDIEQLAVQIESTIEQIQQLEQDGSKIDQTIGELRILLKQMDGNAAAAEAADEAQLALAEMQNLSERYIQIHLAASILRKSIERYREQNQGPVIKRASEIFQRLTLNQFAGIKTDYSSNTDQPILMGIRESDNTGLTTKQMSDGTRDQLYLALRLASIERYKQPRLPLILDDILINFDDERSQATLSILGELSQNRQIIFLTHHPHLIELAQQAVPGDCLVEHRLS
jgi:uncharacterized protein YhaN